MPLDDYLVIVGADLNRHHTETWLWNDFARLKVPTNHNLHFFMCFLGPSMAQSNGSAVHARVSYPGNLTHRGNHDACMDIGSTVFKWNILMINNQMYCFFLCLQTCTTLSVPRLSATSSTSRGHLEYANGSWSEDFLKWWDGTNTLFLFLM